MSFKFTTILILFVAVFLYSDLLWAACTVSTTQVNFGNYDVLFATPTDSTGTISVSCNPRARVTVTIGTSPNSGGFNPRQMKQIAGVDLLNYNLYRDPGRVEIWGDGTGGTFSQWKNVNRNKPRVFSVYGRIPPLQNVSAGPYTDILVVTITF